MKSTDALRLYSVKAFQVAAMLNAFSAWLAIEAGHTAGVAVVLEGEVM